MKATYVSIGCRGVTCPVDLTEQDIKSAGLKLGEKNPLPAKIRVASGVDEPLWLKTHSWISSRKTGFFTLATVADAIKKGLVKLVKNQTWTRKSDGKKFSGDLLFPASWKEGMEQPYYVGVASSANYPARYGRVEKNAVNEPNGAEARNIQMVCAVDGLGGRKPKAAKPAPAKPKVTAKVKIAPKIVGASIGRKEAVKKVQVAARKK